MTLPVRLTFAAVQDLALAERWYLDEAPYVLASFEEEIDRAFSVISDADGAGVELRRLGLGPARARPCFKESYRDCRIAGPTCSPARTSRDRARSAGCHSPRRGSGGRNDDRCVSSVCRILRELIDLSEGAPRTRSWSTRCARRGVAGATKCLNCPCEERSIARCFSPSLSASLPWQVLGGRHGRRRLRRDGRDRYSPLRTDRGCEVDCADTRRDGAETSGTHGAGLARYGSARRGRRPSARCGSRPARPSHPAARVSHARADSVPSCRFPRGEWQCAIATGSRSVNRSHQLPEESRDRRTEHTEASSRRPDPMSPGRPKTPIALPRTPIGRIQVRSGRRSGSRWRPRSPVERHITVQKGHPREADSRRSAQRCRSGGRFEGRSCVLPAQCRTPCPTSRRAMCGKAAGLGSVLWR